MSSGSNEVREEENTEVLIRMIHYYGFSPKLLCEELYTVLMNSFLHSVTEIKEALVEQHPERSKDLHDCFTKLLEKESFGLFQILHKFKDYFIHNFKISPAVSLYPIRNASLRKGGLMKLREWSRKTRAVKELNKRLREAIMKTKVYHVSVISPLETY
jgi:hypothetical protein